MNKLHKLYSLFLIILCVGCSDVVELEQPIVKMDSMGLETEFIAVMGDVQEYTYANELRPYFQHTMDWLSIAKTKGLNLNCVLFTGDLTENNSAHDYIAFHSCVEGVAAQIPVVCCIGNHDYYWEKGTNYINNRFDTPFSQYVTFDNAKAEIVARFEKDRMENIVVENYILGERYDILSLEFGSRAEVVQWARTHVQTHPNRKYILLTHEFLWGDGRVMEDNECWAVKQLCNTTVSAPMGLWDELIKDNNNIALVLCGHNGFSAINYMTNAAGRDVPLILFNLQYQVNGGDGMVELWEASEGNDSIRVGVYHTIRNEWCDAPETKFKFKYRY